MHSQNVPLQTSKPVRNGRKRIKLLCSPKVGIGLSKPVVVGEQFEYHGQVVTLLEQRGTLGAVRLHDTNAIVEVNLGALTAPRSEIPVASDDRALDGPGMKQVASRRILIMKIIADGTTDRAELSALGAPFGLQWRQLQRLRRAFLANGTLLSLAPGKPGRKEGRSLLSLDQSRAISKHIQAAKAQRTHTSLAALARGIRKECELAKIRCPAMSTIAKRARAQDLALRKRRRLGVAVVQDQLKRHAGAHAVSRALEEIQIDHSPVDLIVLDETRRYVLGRPWLTLVLDVGSRAVLGFYLSFDAPSMVSVARALAVSVIPKHALLHSLNLGEFAWNAYGIGRRYYTDRASEFRCEAWIRGWKIYGAEYELRPLGQKHFGGHIERLIGTIMGDLHLLPGTTFSNAKLRKEYQAEKSAILTGSDLLRVIVCAINKYMHTVHSALNLTPQQVFLDGLSNLDGQPVFPPILKDPNAFLLDFMPRCTAVNRPTGLRWRGHRYFDDALHEVPLGSRIAFIPDHDHTSSVTALIGGRQVRLPRITTATYEQISYECELRYAQRSRGRAPEMLEQVEYSLKARDTIVQSARSLKRTAQRQLDAPVESSIGSSLTPGHKAMEQEALDIPFASRAPDYPVD